MSAKAIPYPGKREAEGRFVFPKPLSSLLLLSVALACSGSHSFAAEILPQETEFFETRIRPVLAENCYVCHGAQAETTGAGLRLDQADGLLKGGTRGPAVLPGRPDGSLLIKAINYRDADLQMPPTGKLSDAQIADFERWVQLGAPDPRRSDPTRGPDEVRGIDLESARAFWSLQPIQEPPLPKVRNQEWGQSSIDRFVLARLEKEDLTPAPPATKRALLRRITFSLIGLPPSPREIENFLADESPQAYTRVVERLLASPHYGERWARHWLDLVRFAETNGHEYDNRKLDAWRYRDYVIRAFNSDLPYDRFLTEQIAGDLISDPRLSPHGDYWVSPIGTTHLWFGEVLNSPTDPVKSRADEVDNQLDVLGKAVLGLTLACARCHDHKFDPIPTADYYSIAGILHSTEYAEEVLDSPSRTQQISSAKTKIETLNSKLQLQLKPLVKMLGDRVGDDLMNAAEDIVVRTGQPSPIATKPKLIRSWVEYLREAASEPDHVFYPIAAILTSLGEGVSFEQALAKVREELADMVKNVPPDSRAELRGEETFEDFGESAYANWRSSGQAFGLGPRYHLPPNQPLRGTRGFGLASSFGGGTNRLTGSLTSNYFEPTKRWLHVRLAGTKEEGEKENAKLRLSLVNSRYKSMHFRPSGSGYFEWQSHRLSVDLNRSCYFELVDRDPTGHIVVDRIVFSDSGEAPKISSSPNRHVLDLLNRSDLSSLRSLTQAYQEMFRLSWESGTPDRDTHWLLRSIFPFKRMEDAAYLLASTQLRRVQLLAASRSMAEKEIPESIFAIVARDHGPHNVRIHTRGDHKNLGEEVPRRNLRALARGDRQNVTQGSGRLKLAQWATNPANPLTARVLVNRVWKHHFGRGIVDSPDNFGKTGGQPTHPELLDYLASRFIKTGWSIKSLHQVLLLSSTYQMSSRVGGRAGRVDPGNKFLHHVPIRRLEAEAIRDSVLAVSGQLDRQLFGPSVTPHVTEHQQGRGRPHSGPLLGEGRRSIYIEIRRNFLTPMFLAFDYPVPTSTLGARGTSTVPSQALIMMNNAFVRAHAKSWGIGLSSSPKVTSEKIAEMFLSALGRPPTTQEVVDAESFLKDQNSLHQQSSSPHEAKLAAWSDLGHVLLNSTEFIFVR